MQEDSMAEKLCKITVQIRADHPTLNFRAIYFKLLPEGIKRDKFESPCTEWEMLQQRPIKRAKTTFNSGVLRFDNLLNDHKVAAIYEAYVSDITYYEVDKKFYHITFIIDAFSRYILRYAVLKRLVTEQIILKALEMIITYKKAKLKVGIIFHSDGGG
jgi:transposase InsO family protein